MFFQYIVGVLYVASVYCGCLCVVFVSCGVTVVLVHSGSLCSSCFSAATNTSAWEMSDREKQQQYSWRRLYTTVCYVSLQLVLVLAVEGVVEMCDVIQGALSVCVP